MIYYELVFIFEKVGLIESKYYFPFEPYDEDNYR
jgi:hypothetical protein